MADDGRPADAAWRILIVDDVPAESRPCVTALETVTDELYEIQSVTSARDGLEVARAWRPDLIILDINLPEMDGYELARCLKADGSDASRLFLTNRAAARDEAEGLDLADDFIAKSFNARVFLKRVRNILSRRPQPNAATTQAPRDWRPQVDAVRHRVTMPDGRVIRVTPNGIRALLALVHASGEAVSYASLIREVWTEEADAAGEAFDPGDFRDSLFATISRLREKIEPDPGYHRFIINVERVGYRYNPRADESDGSDGSD
jgi:two-component system OmpR family response regulator